MGLQRSIKLFLFQIKATFKNNAAAYVVAFFAFFNGFIEVISTLHSHYAYLAHAERYDYLLLEDPTHIGRTLSIMLGFILIYTATKLLSRSRVAWFISVCSSVALFISHSFFKPDLIDLIVPTISIILLVIYHGQFKVRSDYERFREGVERSLLIFVVAVFYGAVGFLFLSHKDIDQVLSVMQSIKYALKEIFLFQSNFVFHSKHARLFSFSLSLIGFTSYGLIFLSLFKPLKYRLSLLPHDQKRAEELITKYGGGSEDFFKLWPHDKRYWIQDETCIAYKVVRGVALILGEPIGKSDQIDKSVNDFFEFSMLNGWQTAAVHCSLDGAGPYLKQPGMKKFKIGEEAIVDINEFVSVTAKNKHWRNIRNRFVKAEFSCQVLSPPYSVSFLNEIKYVSDSWLTLPGKEEHTFGLGYFDYKYLNQCSILELRDQSGKLVSFLNLVHSYNPNEANIDLFRHLKDTVPNVNDYMFYVLIYKLKQEDISFLNIGLCPLKGLDNLDKQTTITRAIKVIYNTNLLFAFKGLIRFKGKFEPAWRDSYIIYRGGPAGLLRTTLAINKALKLTK